MCVNAVGGYDCKRVACDQGYRLVDGFCNGKYDVCSGGLALILK